MRVILIDGVKYNVWAPTNEVEFEDLVREHTEDIFGKQSIYFDIKKKLKSTSGICSIPDAYVINLDSTPTWHIVEIELSVHPLYEHVVTQISKFIGGIKSPQNPKIIADTIYEVIDTDDFRKLRLRKAIGPTEIHKFLSDLLMKPPVLTVIIEKDTEELREALKALAYLQIKVVEFQTFARADIGLGVHAHLFEPLSKATTAIKPAIATPKPEPTSKKIMPFPVENALEITLSALSCRKYHLIYVPKKKRNFFPGYKVPFKLETDIGTIETHVSSASKGPEIGDPQAGGYFQAGLAPWYKAHPEINIGSKIVVKAVEPMKLYRLSISSI